ncbi:phage replisome organizer N-terminal domain-containing protein [Clostridium sp. YIM B02505]|uniref:Phage replisome organizer N-terminal domain-containing protein n=1 Tax=Clostridium yunnanense TaxID=2800325 RepID=A0ABS1EWS5_9CLOT|nr:phage replisome organizer N-terminal domain-containing protein [Clostridium yunnanense]MBK1813848.1 phage replisome organizer N-terminal domain-containing protein [Clostridium yunnanense]
MRERKYVKFRVDMYEDTKFKIIDMKPERDVIHYIWSRIVMLAGKVNMEGGLFLSKSIPYTIDTLAIEFNRDSSQVKLALDTFVQLEMIEFTEGKIYIVKNFVKHQNIKIRKTETTKAQDTDINNMDTLLDETFEVPTDIDNNKDKESTKVENSVQSVVENEERNLKTTGNEHIEIVQKIADEKCKNISKKDPPIMLTSKKGTRKGRGKKKENLDYYSKGSDIVCEDIIDEDSCDDMCGIIDGNIHLKPGITVAQWSFG